MNRQPTTFDRPKQEMPEELVQRLLSVVRGQFCADMGAKQWAQHSHFIRRNVIMWPAWFICGKHNFTLPEPRYEQIMRSIFTEIIRNGKTEAVKFWPGYLMKCVQDHWNHHWEEYYREAKNVATLAERAFLACKAVPQADKTVEAIALAQRVLVAKHNTKRQRLVAPGQKPAKQLSLFGS